MTNESEFGSWFRKELIPEVFPGSSVHKISDGHSSGYPDVMIITPSSGVIAVELKYIKRLPKTINSVALKHQLSPLQRKFLINWGRSCNGNSFVTIGCGEGELGRLYIINAGRLLLDGANNMSVEFLLSNSSIVDIDIGCNVCKKIAHTPSEKLLSAIYRIREIMSMKYYAMAEAQNSAEKPMRTPEESDEI